MTRMPRLTGEQVIQFLRKEGFEVARRRSSHVMLKHPEEKGTDLNLSPYILKLIADRTTKDTRITGV